jgi:hypothetical protein
MNLPMRAVVLAFVFCSCLVAAQPTCTACHARQAQHYAQTPMARALLRGDTSEILSTLTPLTFADGSFRYTISGNQYQVTDGQATISAPILWSFGAGIAGQTYVFEYEGALYESRVSYYPRIKGLDLTIGAAGSKPTSLLMAAGRRMHTQDVSECFGCHSTSSGRFTLQTMTPGVQCGACHTDTAKHEVSVASLPRSLRKLNTEEVSELCGRCHRTWEQISINGPKGVANVRFQPYRLTNSKCYDAEDRRISCVACHDPHANLETRAETYDAKCVACHSKTSNSAASRRICNTGTARCTECHMPKYEIPGSHMIFSDHQIRIVRNKEDYPN